MGHRFFQTPVGRIKIVQTFLSADISSEWETLLGEFKSVLVKNKSAWQGWNSYTQYNNSTIFLWEKKILTFVNFHTIKV